MDQSGWIKPPGGFYSTTEDWLARANFPNKTPEYTQFHYDDDDTGAYSRPKGLESCVHWKFTVEMQRKPPPAFVVVIPDGRVWGAKGAVLTPDNKLLWDVSVDYGITARSHPVFTEKRLPPVQSRKDTAAVLTFCASQYYYHWMFDVLPRINLLRRKKIPIDKFILNFNGSLPFQMETLSRLGIPRAAIIACHKRFHLQARKLVVPSICGYTGHMPKWSCEFLRKEFLPPNKAKVSCKRLYISRENAGSRKVLNDDQVASILAKYGFEKMVLETLSVTKQAQLFASAEAIISPHGGGLTNLVFCRPGTKVLEFFSPNYVNVLYWVLSNHVELDYYYLIGEGKRPAEHVDPHIVGDDIMVNLNQLNEILTMMEM